MKQLFENWRKFLQEQDERKVVEICELLNERGIKINPIFKYDFKKEKLKRVGKSIRVSEKIRHTFSIGDKEMKSMLKEKEKLLKKLKGKANFKEFFDIAEKE